MACNGRYADADEYAAFWCVNIDSDEEEATINNYLDIAASDIHTVMAQTGMCDCTLADWATGFLAKLNIVDAAIYHSCPCGRPKITDEMRQAFLTWMNTQLEAIRTGALELCAGATGADFPAVGWAEQSLTDFAAAQIINNYRRRQG